REARRIPRLVDATRECIDCGTRTLERHVVAQTGDDAQVEPATRTLTTERLGVLERDPHIRVRRIREAGRHDANHRERIAAEEEALVQDPRIAAEALLPERPRQDDHVAVTGLVLRRREGATELGTDAEDVEEVRADHADIQIRRLAGTLE